MTSAGRGRADALVLLRSAAYNFAFFGFSFVCALAMLPLMLLPRQAMRRAARFWSAGLLWLLERLVGLDWRVVGAANLPDRPALIAMKHQSTWDTVVVLVLFDDPAIVIKRELLLIPCYGWYARKTGMIPIDRTSGATALRRMLAAARRAVAAGRPVIVYPEGTRTAPGATRPYRPGVSALYRDLGLPVVPVALNSGVFWGRRAFVKRPGTITISLLEPIPPGLGRAEFMAELERRIEDETARLVAETHTQRGG